MSDTAVADALRRMAMGVAPDYPNLAIADPLEHLFAISESFVGLKVANDDLQAIVDKLPKCYGLNDDGDLVLNAPMAPGMRFYTVGGEPCEVMQIELRAATIKMWLIQKGRPGWLLLTELYETPEVAEAAREA